MLDRHRHGGRHVDLLQRQRWRGRQPRRGGRGAADLESERRSQAGSQQEHATRSQAPLQRSFVFNFNLSENAKVAISLDHRTPGRLVRGKCVTPKRGNIPNRRCGISYSHAGSISIDGKAGADSYRFNGRIGSKPLRTGVYRASLVATGADGVKSAQPARAFLKVVYRTRRLTAARSPERSVQNL